MIAEPSADAPPDGEFFQRAAFALHIERALPDIELGTYPGVTVKALLHFYAQADKVFTVCRDRKIVGHAEVRVQPLSPHRATVSAAVERAYWGKGLGSEVLGKALQWCDAQGIAWVDGWRWADNERARRMDHALGFVDVYTLQDAWRDAEGRSRDQVVMIRAKGGQPWEQAQQR